MNITKIDLKAKVKDWFFIQKIRIFNFIKEHKYISAFIGIFLVSSIVVLIAFALDDDKYSGKVLASGSVIQKSASSTEEVSTIKSFSTIVYDVGYSLSINDLPTDETVVRDNVIIRAQFNEGVDAQWVVYDDISSNYVVSEDGRTLTVTLYEGTRVGALNNLQLYLNTRNIPNGTVLTTNIGVKESTANDFTEIGNKTMTVESKKVDLETKIVSGSAYKSNDYDGRYAPFGILVGFDKSKLKNKNSLEGLYFDTNANLVLEATQSVNGVNTQIDLETDKKEYFGLYDKSTNLLGSMPNYQRDISNYSVYNSGQLKNFNKTVAGASGEKIESTNPDLYLVGEKVINLEVGESYTEYGVKTKEDSPVICKTNSSSCKRVITNASGENISESDITKNIGEYIVSYEYLANGDNVTTVKRNIKVSAKTTVTLGEDVYSLKGNKNIILESGTNYNDLGIYKNGIAFYEYTSVITFNGEPIPAISATSNLGEYTITYTITETPKETEETPEQSVTLTRTVTVINSLPLTKAQTLTASTIYAPSDGSFANPYVEIDGNSIECTSNAGCSVKYYNLITNEETQINKSVTGTYKAIYMVTDKNGFILQVSNIVNIQTKYAFDIEGIKSDGSIDLYDDSFVSFGSYFVNAKSIREEGITTDIPVNLTASIKKSDGSYSSSTSDQAVVNKSYSAGTKSNNLTFNTDTTGDLQPLSSNDYLGYGEEVILRSVFTYSNDGDEKINRLTTTIPIGTGDSTSKNPTSPFTMVEYTSSAADKEPYYINQKYEDKVTVKYYACEMDEAQTICGNSKITEYSTFALLNDALKENEKLKLAYLTYTIEDVDPGAVIDFRIRLITNVGNRAGKITLTSNSSYDEKSEAGSSITKTKEGDASINITAFKARTRVFIDGIEQDTIINGANVDSSTWTIYPSVSLKAQGVNTNAAGINALKKIEIKVELPEGINYVYDEKYDVPEISGKTLTYVLQGKNVNEWIDPIYFVTSYDIDIPSGEEKIVKVIISAESLDGIEDSSSEENKRTTVRKITYQNNEKIARSQYTNTPTVSKETPFSINTKIYNNDSNKITHSNLDIVTIFPYNDVSNEKNNYTGSYMISNLPNNTLCTSSIPSLINNNLISKNEIIWEDCSKYQVGGNSYSNITAIKVSSLSLTPGKTYEQSITITPTGNKTDDKYIFKSYLITNDNSSIKEFNDVMVEVFSKKITGVVWEDFDDNGLMDADEKRISDVTLKLYDATTDEFISSTTSNKNGSYTLSDLKPGTYYVAAEYNTAKYGFTQPNASYDRSISSSFDSSDKGKLLKENEKQNDEEEDCEDEECLQEPYENPEDENNVTTIVKTNNIEITNDTKTVSDINLGLSLKKSYVVKMTKYVSKAITTNNLGISTIKDYGNLSLAKLDVKDINNLSIKVIYTIELENIGYYPGYIYAVKDYIPDGMKFNEAYEENKGWVMTDYGYLENDTLANELVYEGDKKYLTIAFDITRKEAGSFINFASVDDDDLQILSVARGQGGNNNE